MSASHYSLCVTTAKPIDLKWYEALKPLMMDLGETFEILMPPLERLDTAYSAFKKSHYKSIPNLYPEIAHPKHYVDLRGKLEKLQEEIATGESNEIVKKLYEGRITELLQNIDIIIAASAKDSAAYRVANSALYGKPNIEMYAAATEGIRQQVAKVQMDPDRPELEAICAQVLARLPRISSMSMNGQNILYPDAETFKKVRSLHHKPQGYMDELFGKLKLPADAILTPAEGDEITRQVIRNVGSTFALEASPAGLWSVLQSKSKVIRPADYTLGREAFLGIVAHEVGSHLLESTNGAKSKLRLLELGLGRYERGNEGRAFLREQIMFESFQDYIDQPGWSPNKATWEYRVAIHMVIAMAIGVGGTRYTFPEIFGLLESLFRFWTAVHAPDTKDGAKSPLKPEIDDEVMRRGAWNMAVRALKGTDGNDGIGGAYYKDIVYLEGNIRCWQSARIDPELILLADKGKFDVADSGHVMMLKELGIL